MPLHGGQRASDDSQSSIIALVQGASERAHVRTALRSRYDVRFVDRIAELIQALGTTQRPVSGIIVEARDSDGRSTAETVRQIRAAERPVPLIGYCRTGAENSDEIRALILAGVHELLYQGADDSAVAMRAVLASAHRAQVGQRVAEALASRLPPRLREFVKLAATHPETHHVSALADALGYNRKTLVNHCTQAGSPPPQELLTWCRLAVVGELLTTTTSTIEAIALQLDFPSDTALRNTMKRYTGFRASEVRARGGMQCILDSFDSAKRERVRRLTASNSERMERYDAIHS